MKFMTAMLFGLALIVGVAIGYMFNPSVEEQMASQRSRPAEGAINDAGDSAAVETLRARVAELEAKLAEKSKEAVKPEAEGDDRGTRSQGVMTSPKEWREKMKKDNPQGYIAMTNRIANWRRERLERAQKKVDFFSSLDVSRMSPSARKTHEELQEMIAKREELEQKVQEMENSDEGFFGENRRAIWQEIHQTDERIRELNSSERENLMLETVKSLGFNAADAADVAETFQEIIENTEGGYNATGRPRRRGHGGNPPMNR